MLDTLELETRGIPTALIVAKRFEPSARAWGKAHGIEDFNFVVIDNPAAHLPESEVEKLADQAVGQVMRILTGGGLRQ